MNFLLVMRPGNEASKWGPDLRSLLETKRCVVEMVTDIEAAVKRLSDSKNPKRINHVVSGTMGDFDEFVFEPVYREARSHQIGFTLITGYSTQKGWKRIAEERWGDESFGVVLKNEYSDEAFLDSVDLGDSLTSRERERL